MHRVRKNGTKDRTETKGRRWEEPQGGAVIAGAFVPLFVCGERPLPLALATPPSLEHALQHRRGVGGPGLPGLDGVAEVLDAAAAFPDLLELTREDLGAAFP